MEASTAMFTALNRYSIASSRFSESAQIIERLMELDELTDTSKWPRMASSKVGSQLLSARSSIEFAVNQLPKIISLLERSYNHQEENIESSTQVLSVTLPEEKGKASKPERIIQLIEAVSQLYEVCSEILDNSHIDEIVIVGCDSGSDKSFDFLGTAKAIACLKDLILEIFDRIAFFKEEQFSRRVELVKEVLPVYAQIGELERSNSIGPEAAELCRRKLSEGVAQFIEVGAIIPEMVPRTNVPPRLTMAPEPKLLTSSPKERGESADSEVSTQEVSTQTDDSSSEQKMSLDDFSSHELA